MRTSTLRSRSALALMMGAILVGTTACGAESLTPTDDEAVSAEVVLIEAPAEDLAADVINSIEPSEALVDLVPADIRSEGLDVTTSVGYPPMEQFAADGKVIVGVDPSISRAIARLLGVDLTITDQDFNAQIPGVLTGRFDMVLSSMTDNEERRETITFVDYVKAGNGFLVQTGNPEDVSVPSDLCGEIVAVVDSGSSMLLAQDIDAQCAADGEEAVDILAFPGDGEANLAVKSGRAAATITDYPVAVYRAGQEDSGLEAIAIEGGESPWGIGINKENTELIDLVQKALQELIDSGAYEEILDAWGVGQMAVDSAIINDGQ